MATVVRLSLIMFGLVIIGIVASVLGHTMVVRTWLVAMYGTMKLVTRKVTQMGHVLPQRTPTGEVLSVSADGTYHRTYDPCIPKFLKQAGVQVEFYRMEDVGLRGNSHVMMLEKNSDDIIKWIMAWMKKNTAAGVTSTR